MTQPDTPDRQMSSLLDAEWTVMAATRFLLPIGTRLKHTFGVAEKARAIAEHLRPSHGAALIAAAYCHDCGYAPDLVDTGFHPIDGARWLRGLGYERVACLVANHTGASLEALDLGLTAELAEFPDECSIVTAALNACDITTAPDGRTVTTTERLLEVRDRYGPDSHQFLTMQKSMPGFIADTEITDLILELPAPAGRPSGGRPLS